MKIHIFYLPYTLTFEFIYCKSNLNILEWSEEKTLENTRVHAITSTSVVGKVKQFGIIMLFIEPLRLDSLDKMCNTINIYQFPFFLFNDDYWMNDKFIFILRFILILWFYDDLVKKSSSKVLKSYFSSYCSTFHDKVFQLLDFELRRYTCIIILSTVILTFARLF